MQYEAVIGLETHAQLKTNSKIFCGCSTSFGAEPNHHVCPVCLGMPGVLPVLNKKVVEYSLRMALATNCEIRRESRFARKNYFYPDLPKGYQISQYELPIAEHGWLEVEVNDETRRIGITRIHMEEDAGKLIHDPRRPVSRVDLNRTGVPLIEIVSEPDIRTPEEAGAYLRMMRSILRYLDICDGNMEEGSFRCDANVSVRPKGHPEFGTRAEVKNMNSFRGVERALAYEIRRQVDILEDGGAVVQETRLWDADAGRTTSMRGKEEAHDYRYFPDPDLLPLVVDDDWIDEVRHSLPELPAEKKRRYMKELALAPQDAAVLVSSHELAAYVEKTVEITGKPKIAFNWISSELLALLNTRNITAADSPVPPEKLAALLDLLDKGTISGRIAKTVFDRMVDTGDDPQTIVEREGLVQVSDTGELEQVVDEVLAENPDEIEAYRGGRKKLMGFFVGQVMKKTRGKANPKMVNELLGKKLGQ
ncbi:MAG: Asp-tRNA(Asn)/Glu-tRNA(Gln) amidotransferase subunit GatB [Desulfatibacillaceae bacterium]